MKWRILLHLFLTSKFISLTFQTQAQQPLKILHSWKFANFEFPSKEEKFDSLKHGQYIPANVAILDADYYIDPKTSKKRIFVTTPQFLNGIPATLSEIRDYNHEEPLQTPFPSWNDQNHTTCNGPVSVYRILIDKCGLMWVPDSGVIESFIVPKQVCRPKLLIYNLNNNDEVMERYGFPDGVINEKTTLNTIVTESRQDDCRDSFAYIADVTGRGLIIYELATRSSWRIENPYFYPFPDQAYQTIKGTTFELMDGIFGLAVSPQNDHPRKLYFHSLASIRESWVSTDILKKPITLFDSFTLRHEFHHSEDIRDGQSTVEVMTEDGILIYTVLPKTALACWNSVTPLRKEFQSIIYEDTENLQFISGLKLKNKTLLITSSKLQNYILQNSNGTEVKYRVMAIDNVDKLLDGTPCRNIPHKVDHQRWGNERILKQPTLPPLISKPRQTYK